MKVIQQAVRQLQDEHHLSLPPELATLDLCAEMGELAKEILLTTNYGVRGRTPTSNLESEVGDVFYALISLANTLGIDLGEALEKRMAAYRERFACRRVYLRS